HASLDRSELCRMLTTELQRMIAQDVEFRTDVWTVEEARMQLIRQGWLDAAQLLHTSRAPVTTLQACGQLHALVVGPVVPSARVLQGVRLLPHGDDLLLDYGPLVRPHTSDDAH